MDPRHPEKIVPRLKELLGQYEKLEKGFKKATTLSQLSPLEMEGISVTREIVLLSPRLHEYVIKLSRDNRQRIVNTPYEQVVEVSIPPNQAPTVIAEIKPRKKKVKRNKK